jgi:hypothetical protein
MSGTRTASLAFMERWSSEMPRIQYTEFRFSASTLAVIEQANTIAETYMRQGYNLTLRQLYYQFVSRGLIANKIQEYKRLGSIINDARLAGLLDWNYITDRTRNLKSLGHWSEPGEIISSAAYSYRIDKWHGQQYRPEVWVEKEALADVVERACNPLDVPFFSCRGYVSQSEMWGAAQRLERYQKAGQVPVIVHLGDHDPSGIDMTRDITDRLQLFMGGLEVQRIALNRDQIDEYSPPPNPAKTTDSRYAKYIVLHGDESWELDALEPSVLDDLITSTVISLRDGDAWEAAVKEEELARTHLRQVSKRWPDVTRYVSSIAS